MIGLGLGLGLSAGMSGGASWSPSAETGLRGWYKADAGLVLGSFGSWADQSGIGNDLTGNPQATTAGAGLNGHATVALASGAVVTKSSFSKGSAGEITIWLVFKVTSGQVAVEVADYGDGAFDITGVGFDGTTTSPGMLHNFAANTDGTTDLQTGWHRVVLTAMTGGNQILYIDDIQEASQTASASIADSLNVTLTGTRAGAGAIDLAEWGIYDHVLGSTARASLDSYLTNQFGL